MPTIYEEYAPYRPELTAGEQEMIDTSPDLRQVEMRIGMDRAEEQLRDWPYPESQDTFEKFPGIDPRGKVCDVDMGFFERFTRLQATLPSRPPEVREYIGGVLDQLKDRKSTLSQSWTAMTDDCITIRLINRGAKLAPTAEASEEMLRDAARRSTEMASIQRIDGFLNAMEYAAGISDKVPDERARNFLDNKLKAPIPAKVEAVRTVSNVTPSTLTINFQNFDHIMAQQFCSNPENWGKSPKDMPPDLAESIKVLPLIYRYAPATVDRALQPVFEKIEDMPGKQITDYLDRGGLITVDGKTVRSMMEESYKGDPENFTDWYRENVREMTNRFVSSGLMSGKRVEALIPDAKGKFPKEPVQITKSGYEPSPLKKVTLNDWERYFAKHGHYKAKAAKAAEYQRVMEGREQMRSNCLSGTLAAHAISRNQTENLFFSEYKQELGGRTDVKLNTMVEDKGIECSAHFRLSRSAPVSTCICYLAAQGHSIQDIMNPDKLQVERQAAGKLYMEKAIAKDNNWLGETYFHGIEALTKQVREIFSQCDLTNRESTLAVMPEAEPALRTMFDSYQEKDRVLEAFYLAAEKEHPGKGVEYADHVCATATGASNFGDVVTHELHGYMALASPNKTDTLRPLSQIVEGAGMREIMKNSSEPDPLRRIDLLTLGTITRAGGLNPSIRDMAKRLNKDPAARRAVAHLAYSGQFQDKVHISIGQMLEPDGTPMTGNRFETVYSLVKGEDGQLHLKSEKVKVTQDLIGMKITPSKSLQASMEKHQKAQEFQAKHPLSDLESQESKKADPKKESPQKPAPKKQAPAKGGGGRTK